MTVAGADSSLLQDLMDEHPIATFTVDGAGKITSWNKAAEELTGKTSSQVVGKKAWTGFSSKRITTPVDEALREGEAIEEDFTVTHAKTSQSQKVLFKAVPKLDGDSEPVGAIATMITAIAGDSDLVSEASQLKSALEGSATPTILINRDFEITYLNPASYRLFERNLSVFKAEFKSFALDSILGTCIDQFHVNPAHQRKLLSDPRNLPYTADIQVGSLTFELNVSAMVDQDGEYIGNALEWADVTRSRADSSRARGLESMIEGAATNLMMCDLDLRITYCNPAVVSLLSRYQPELRKAFNNFDAQNLVGRKIDDFHVNPALQRGILLNPKNLPYKTEIKVGPLEFGLNASGLFDEDGKQMGAAVEWLDFNDRSTYRDEVSSLIQACLDGDLQRRGETKHLSAVFVPMMEGINSIIDAIVAPISELRDKLEDVSDGDLTSYLTGDYKGEHANLKNSLNGTLDSLNEILSQVKVVAEQVNTGARQVSDAAQSLSQGATEQAAALEEITASMTEMAAQTKQNAENATQANQLALQSRQNAQNGNSQMKEMLGSMKGIDASSKNISKIIKVIDEIAFQTNLLALNAAVEAARAGVHGKGFAVVAEEVRNLAARSANAAKETTVMIEESIKEVSQGAEIASRTAKALDQISDSITKVTDLVAEIAAASNEQAQGISQVNKALGQMEQVTQQNTANAEQSAAASQQLSSQSDNLQEMMARFKVREKQAANLNMTNISPEMLQAFQEFMRMQGFAGSQPAPKPATGSSVAPRPYGGRPARSDDGASVDPSQIISLDDTDFGKY